MKPFQVVKKEKISVEKLIKIVLCSHASRPSFAFVAHFKRLLKVVRVQCSILQRERLFTVT